MATLTTPSEARARYLTPVNVFRTKQADVPIHAFAREREEAFAPGRATGFLPLDRPLKTGLRR